MPASTIAVDGPGDENTAPDPTTRKKRAPLGEVSVAADLPDTRDEAPRMTNADILGQAAIRRANSSDNKVTYGDVLAGSVATEDGYAQSLHGDKSIILNYM